MDEYGNDDGWTSNYNENDYYSPDDQYQSVATVSGDSQYDLPSLYEEPNTFGYGQTSNINLGQYNPYETSWDNEYTPQMSANPQYQQPDWYQNLLGGNLPPQPEEIALPQMQQAQRAMAAMPQATPPTASQGTLGGISSILSSLFSGGSKLLAAGMEGSQNKKKEAVYKEILSNPNSPYNKIAPNSPFDPFNSERPFYQQQARQTVIDPYSSPIVRNQINEIQRQQNIKDAAAGRRSNMVGSAPAVMAEQAKVAQNYLDQMLKAGGQNISPNAQAIAQLQTGAANAGINGYTSPLVNAVGNIGQSYQTQENLGQILEALQQQKVR